MTVRPHIQEQVDRECEERLKRIEREVEYQMWEDRAAEAAAILARHTAPTNDEPPNKTKREESLPQGFASWSAEERLAYSNRGFERRVPNAEGPVTADELAKLGTSFAELDGMRAERRLEIANAVMAVRRAKK